MWSPTSALLIASLLLPQPSSLHPTLLTLYRMVPEVFLTGWNGAVDSASLLFPLSPLESGWLCLVSLLAIVSHLAAAS